MQALKIKNAIALNLVLLLLLGCGRMGRPFIPEELSAKSVRELIVTPQKTGITFEWKAPTEDVKGRPLRSLDGYAVMRVEVDATTSLDPDQLEFKPVEVVQDKYLAQLKAEQKRAIVEGIPLRKVQIAENFTRHSYTDTNVESGKRYLYQITAVNQNGVYGASSQFVDLVFKGESTKVDITENIESENDLTEDEQ